MSFGAEISDAYATVFENNAPMWGKITELVGRGLAGKELAEVKILDVGSGPGEPSTTLAKAFPQASIVCTDKEADMVAKAEKRAAGLANVSFKVIGADDLSEFPDASFDAVTLVYVLMFVPERARCLSEIARVLKPGSRAYLVVWRELQLFKLLEPVMQKLYGGAAPPPLINPLALKEEGAVETLVAATDGLTVESSEQMVLEFCVGHDERKAFLAGSIPIQPNLKQLEASGREGIFEEARTAWVATARELGFVSEERGFVIPGSHAHIVVVRRAA